MASQWPRAREVTMSDIEFRPGSGSGVPVVDGDQSRLERFELLAAR